VIPLIIKQEVKWVTKKSIYFRGEMVMKTKRKKMKLFGAAAPSVAAKAPAKPGKVVKADNVTSPKTGDTSRT
jgi:hypothetical protein